MNPDDDVFLAATAMAILGVANWISGDRPVFGLPLVLRKGAFWLACRWFGLGLLVASSAAGAERSATMSWLALWGSVAILVGTARQRKKMEFRIDVPDSENRYGDEAKVGHHADQ